MILSERSLVKKFVIFACITLVGVALMVAVAPSKAFADWHDVGYHSWIDYRSISYTDMAPKEDYTSSWDDCANGPSHKVEVFATGYAWDPQYVGSPYAYFGPGIKGYLDNFVKESGYPCALLWFSEPNANGYITGAWSPDSI